MTSIASGSKVLHASEADMQKMLAAHVHLGTKNVNNQTERYVYARTKEGVHVFNLHMTWEKLILAARVIVAIENPGDVCVISARPWGQRAVLKFAKYTGAQAIAGRFTPGTFTNQIQKKFLEPRLLIVTDPRTDHQPIREASYVNIPCVAFAHTDSPLKYVDIAIPCNNKAKHSIGLMYWLLAREVPRLRGALARTQQWDVMVDMFFYRDPDEAEKTDEAGQGTAEESARNMFEAPAAIEDGTTPGGEWGQTENQWDQATATTGEWGASGAAPTGEWADATDRAPAPAGGNWDGGNVMQAGGGWDASH